MKTFVFSENPLRFFEVVHIFCRFFGFQELKNHVQRHHGSVRVFTCGQCSAKFSCKAALRSHRLQEHKHTDHSGKACVAFELENVESAIVCMTPHSENVFKIKEMIQQKSLKF